MADQQELSPQAYQRLKAELEELSGEGRIEIANKIEAARALGDLSENGDYHAAKDQQGQMEARIRQLEAILIDAVVVEPPANDGSVAIGSVVEIRFEGDDDTESECGARDVTAGGVLTSVSGHHGGSVTGRPSAGQGRRSLLGAGRERRSAGPSALPASFARTYRAWIGCGCSRRWVR